MGCQRGIARLTLECAIDTALSPLGAVVVRCLASHVRKSAEPALLELAQIRGWPLRFYSPEALAGVAVPTPSARVAGEVGTPSVAEAAARLAADGGELLVAKQRHQGIDGTSVTVAVAHWRQR
ncbi:cobalamin biosynthesis protein [Allochromatium palmeri]|uniref:cobalamin biosynthesis protein n=1 Tax=Allochromatium palmeri TaxID=231048 RepID=UPI0031B60FA8